MVQQPITRTDEADFELLKLVERPHSNMNSPNLPQTLEDCQGYLTHLPLVPPNSDKKSSNIANMVNILTLTEAQDSFAKAAESMTDNEAAPGSGIPPRLFDEKTSPAMKQLLRMANKQCCHVRAPGVLGHVVFPGSVSFYSQDGKTYAVSEGRWMLTSLKAKWLKKNVPINSDKIELGADSKVLILRVRPGEVALVRDLGVELLLDVGIHVFNSGTVSFEGIQVYANSEYFHHGRYHYLRVPRGKFAKVWAEVKDRDGNKSVVPRLLTQGEHFVDNFLFRCEGFVDCSQEYIGHGSVHQVSVTKGNVAKVVQDNKPRLLGEGTHLIESTDFSYGGMVSIVSNLVIVHKTITILRVTLGSVALAWQDSEPVFITEQGLYEFDSPDFEFVEFKDASDRLIHLGAKKIVLVQTGEVGVTYNNGTLKILTNGRHLINSSTHIFHRFLSTQQKSIRLATLNADEKIRRSTQAKARKSHTPWQDTWSADEESKFPTSGPDSDLTVCETKDLVKVGLRADVFYSIEDPDKCINKIDTDELEDLVRETAVATLTNIIRSTALNEIAQSKQVSAGPNSDGGLFILQPPEQDKATTPAPAKTSRPMFFERAHDEFLNKLHDDFMERYGVDICNIRIESFKIMDQELSEQISKHALTTAQIENEMANLEGKSLISTTQERTAADVKNINAQAEAEACKTHADAENQRKIEKAKTDAEALRIAAQSKAEMEAEAILTIAKATAEAIRLKAAAEAQRAEMLSNTNLGQQEALLAIYKDMVVQSNSGVEKIVYMDPSVNRDSPFALGSLNNLNMDLHALSTLGIAAGEHTTTDNKGKK
jgi:regulator of protease activity HflC (stomatin/prohibitin superfamily)